MKENILLTLFTCLIVATIPITAICQETGAKSIIIKREGSSDDNYKFIGNFFLNKDFKILSKDVQPDFDFYQITFEPIIFAVKYKLNKELFYLIITAKVSQDNITLTAQHKMSAMRKRDTVYDPKKKETIEVFKMLTEFAVETGEDFSYSK